MRTLIGELLKDEGVVSAEMIAYALKVQQATGERLGDTLLRLKFVTDTEIARVLARQAGLDFTPLTGLATNIEALRQLPYNFAQRYEILPLDMANGTLRVAVADPFGEEGIAKISRYVTVPFELVVAPRDRLLLEVERLYYRAEHPVEDDLAQIVADVQAGRQFRTGQLMHLLTGTAIDLGASDMHITSTSFATLVSYRIDGVLQLRYSLPQSMHQRLVSAYKVEAGMDVAELHRPQDGRMDFEFLHRRYDMRVSCVPTADGDSLVVRILSGEQDLKSLDELGYSGSQLQIIAAKVREPHGMVLVTGPTGSGKSTTLYGLLRRVDAMQRNVLTVEDPVEFRMPLARQVAVNEKAGITFASAIRSFLRQDPDVLLVGEIRDQETAQLASRAAQTGHLVLSTLHTNDAVGAVARLRDLGVGDFTLAATLSCVVAQRLVRRLCPYCRQRENDHYRRGEGCDHCRHTGYLGRVAVAEVLQVDEHVRVAIDAGASPLEIRRLAAGQGMRDLRDAALGLVRTGVTDLDEVERVVRAMG